MKIDHQVGVRKALIEGIVEFLKEPKLPVWQVFVGEQKGFYEEIVRYGKIIEEILREQISLELLISFGHEKELYGKSEPFWLFVKQWEEGIVVKLF